MSTSSNKAARAPVELEVMSFPYPEVTDHAPPGSAPWTSQKDQQQKEEAAREAGRREAEARAQAVFAAQVQELRKNIATAIEQFAGERREYFLAEECEVVQLSLAIARKILHREAQIDPLLLAGMVRVALDRTGQGTRISVHVAPQQVSDFRVFFARTLQNQPEVIEDPSLAPDQCVLHTALGSTTVGPEVQLKEIEQGLLDLQGLRPGSGV